MKHSVVIPIYGRLPSDFISYSQQLEAAGMDVIVVDNRCEEDARGNLGDQLLVIPNNNRGGIAGGFNRGIEAALARGAEVITLLDQDSRIEATMIRRLREPLELHKSVPLVVGPMVWDSNRRKIHGRRGAAWNGYQQTRLLISSGTTFRTSDWSELGRFNEELFIDYVDHYWCFHGHQKGFTFIQHPQVVLRQVFGSPHPNWLCRHAGMQLYSPTRHFYSLRNLRWLLRQPCVPWDLKLKELMKMLVKPAAWLLLERRKKENLIAIITGLTCSLPGNAP